MTNKELERTNTPEASEDSPLIGYVWETQGTKNLAYMTDAGSIYALVAGKDGTWKGNDVVEHTQAPKAFGSALAGFVWETGGTQQIAYISENQHVQELSAGTDGVWSHSDITQATQAPLAADDSLIGFEWSSSFAKQIVYIDTAENPHIHELMLQHGSEWKHTDVTTLTGASDLV